MKPTPAVAPDIILERLDLLTEVGIDLSAEKNHDRLLEKILEGAMQLTHADAGTLYLKTNDDHLKMVIVRNNSLGYAMGGTSGNAVPFDPIPLFDGNGRPNVHMVVACAVLCGEGNRGRVINIEDAYEAADYDFSGTRAFDAKTGYRSKSFLTIPMRNHENEIVGVLQLINAIDQNSGEIIAFSEADQRLAEALASQAAVTLTQRQLIEELEALFQAFIRLIATAIDEKSPYTGGHCRRVPELTLMIADAASRCKEGPLKDFRMSDEERYELEVAAWLHDCGKVTTPEYVIDKRTKLETIFDRIHLVDACFAVLLREAEVRVLRRQLEKAAILDQELAASLEHELEEEKARLAEEKAFFHRCNIGGEYMDERDQQRVKDIGTNRIWHDLEGNAHPLLSDDMIHNLTIAKGTLTDEEREVINHHIVATIKMLESLPFPKHLQHVPEFAGGHHERMDGKGYPRGLRREQLSWQARMMAIADVFEALTAADRPYKKAMKLSQALTILGRMKLDHHIDPDLFDVFIRERVYEEYARRFLRPEQIDEVVATAIPGYGVEVPSSAGE